MTVPSQCPRCGYSYLIEKEFLYHIDLSCQKCGWSEDYPYPNDSMAHANDDTLELTPSSNIYNGSRG